MSSSSQSLPIPQGALAVNTVAGSITRVLGVSAIVFFALGLGPMISQSSFVPLWYLILGGATVFGVPALIAVSTFAFSPATIRVALAAYAVSYLVVVIVYPAVMSERPLPIEFLPWPLGVTGLGTVAAALVWRPKIVWAYLATHVVAMVVVRALASGFVDRSVPFQDGLLTLGFSSIFTALALVSLRTAGAVDAAAHAAQLAATRAAAAIARTREQARLDALVHDEIMSAFLYASRESAGLEVAVQRQAARAIEQLERVARGDPLGGPVSFADFVDRARDACVDLSPAVRFAVTGQRAAGLPAEVASAFTEATAEAVRNSYRHGGRGQTDVVVTVTVAAGDELVAVRIEDNGVGFSPGLVDAYRLGISVSIVGRMDSVPGGRALISSKPGHGTSVLLEWAGR